MVIFSNFCHLPKRSNEHKAALNGTNSSIFIRAISIPDAFVFLLGFEALGKESGTGLLRLLTPRSPGTFNISNPVASPKTRGNKTESSPSCLRTTICRYTSRPDSKPSLLLLME
ncbi:hypothetical protein H112_03464 [Trichophyton rubrum D6]|uniref:Uncharacterized protein n=2 Tax=Trichophyton TaxID=5550 RepID=A0A022W5C5_TRIRU|nr:hypothetical protein H103_03473 [Trichophyton rubrum CBS 288.86]EZF64263.1 hypothetical protein H104_03458 [Trichophyton rubrum CBS 289.86]EZF74801.1 hypothetical protein H105_03485 [Trichophyton soudanense CBS 452.61]KDB34776.1 hypothetical protein H112_03464 [Trichophyton rubrum D6]